MDILISNHVYIKILFFIIFFIFSRRLDFILAYLTSYFFDLWSLKFCSRITMCKKESTFPFRLTESLWRTKLIRVPRNCRKRLPWLYDCTGHSVKWFRNKWNCTIDYLRYYNQRSLVLFSWTFDDTDDVALMWHSFDSSYWYCVSCHA